MAGFLLLAVFLALAAGFILYSALAEERQLFSGRVRIHLEDGSKVDAEIVGTRGNFIVCRLDDGTEMFINEKFVDYVERKITNSEIPRE